MVRISIQLNDEELSALRIFAKREMRNFRKQAQLIIRQKLEVEGLISASDSDIENDVEDITLSTEEMQDEKKS